MAKDFNFSLIHAMSLSGRELFHSNVWAWMMERDAEFFKVFFPWVKGSVVKVEREKKGRDLTVTVRSTDGKDLKCIIENKLKAYPDRSQLERYSLETKGPCVLAGVLQPAWFKELSSWSFCDYGHVIAGIMKSLKKTIWSSTDRLILNEYCTYTETLLKLVRRVAEKYKEKFAEKSEFSQYADRRMDGFLQKITALGFADSLYKCLQSDKEVKWEHGNYTLRIAPEFLHGEAFVYAYYEKTIIVKRREVCDRRIGIEFQGGEYRYGAEVRSNSDLVC